MRFLVLHWAKKLSVKIVIIFLSISLNMCFGCSKELSHRDSSFEYPKHMFCLRNKKNNFQLCKVYLIEHRVGYKCVMVALRLD